MACRKALKVTSSLIISMAKEFIEKIMYLNRYLGLKSPLHFISKKTPSRKINNLLPAVKDDEGSKECPNNYQN